MDDVSCKFEICRIEIVFVRFVIVNVLAKCFLAVPANEFSYILLRTGVSKKKAKVIVLSSTKNHLIRSLNIFNWSYSMVLLLLWPDSSSRELRFHDSDRDGRFVFQKYEYLSTFRLQNVAIVSKQNLDFFQKHFRWNEMRAFVWVCGIVFEPLYEKNCFFVSSFLITLTIYTLQHI